MSKQFSKSVLCALVIALAHLALSSSVFAQLQPAISPWMGMLDRTRAPGSISAYHDNVRPQQQLMKAYASQQSQMQAQQQALRALQDGGISGGTGGGGVGPRDLAGGASPGAGGSMILSAPREIPSTQRNPAGFNQYLHYYPSGSLPRRPVPNFSSAGGRR